MTHVINKANNIEPTCLRAFIIMKKNKKHYSIVIALTCIIFLFSTEVCFASIDYTAIGDAGIDMTVEAMKYIAKIVGAILTIIGIVKFVQGHSSDDTQGPQKGAMMIATGIALIVISSLLLSKDFKSMIDTNGRTSAQEKDLARDIQIWEDLN